jgi:hypothetical protein
MLFGLCSEKSALPEGDLKAYVMNPENGLVKAIEKNGIRSELIYRPKELLIVQEVGYDSLGWLQEKAKLKGNEYFTLRFSKDGDEIENSYISQPEKHASVINYLNGQIAEDIHIVIGDKKINIETAIFAPSFGSSNFSSIMIMTRCNLLESKTGSFLVVFDDTKLGLGRCEFRFDFRDIANVPKLAGTPVVD